MPNFNLSQTGQGVQNDLNLIENGLASKYSALSTYNPGDIVIHNDKLYVCSLSVAEPEPFDNSKWTETTLAAIIANLKPTLYQHSILFWFNDSDNGRKGEITLNIFNSSNISFTVQTLLDYLYNNGVIACSGMRNSTDTFINRLESNNQKTYFWCYYSDVNMENTMIAVVPEVANLSDNVIRIL